MAIAKGSKVSWSYQAGGIEFSQSGVVLAFVAVNNSAVAALGNLGINATSRQSKFTDTSTNARYLVQTDNNGVPNFYAPTASALEKQNPSVNVSDAVAPVQADTQSNAVQVVPKVRTKVYALGDVYTKGNHTKYTVFALDENGAVAAYRVMGSTVKIVIEGRKGKAFNGAYKSSVRDAQCVYACPVLINTTEKVEDLTAVEAAAYATSIGAAFNEAGFSGTIEALVASVQKSATASGTRRIVTAEFYPKW